MFTINCTTCKGTGWSRHDKSGVLKEELMGEECWMCRGQGKHIFESEDSAIATICGCFTGMIIGIIEWTTWKGCEQDVEGGEDPLRHRAYAKVAMANQFCEAFIDHFGEKRFNEIIAGDGDRHVPTLAVLEEAIQQYVESHE